MAAIKLYPHRNVRSPSSWNESEVTTSDWRRQGVGFHCVSVAVSREGLTERLELFYKNNIFIHLQLLQNLFK